ncbi:MAG TPA: DUF2804 domain-containing protein [Candidatus Nanopelagicales bacterium]
MTRDAARPAVEPLRSAPARGVAADGTPAFGGFAGIVDSTGLAALAQEFQLGRRGPLGVAQRALRHKRWVYVFVATDELCVVAGMANGAVTGSGFLMATDLTTGEVLVDSSRMGALAAVNDCPGAGLRAGYRLPGTRYALTRDDDEARFTASLGAALLDLPGRSRPWVEVDLTLREHGTGITAVSEVRHGRESTVSVTAKTCGMAVTGQLRVHAADGPVTRTLDGGLGGYDYTNGWLPRHTAWRWAYGVGRLASGEVLGFNLTEGFSGVGERSREAAAWVDGQPFPVDPRLHFRFDRADVLAPWRVTTEDGSVRLRFDPLAAHRESVDLRVLRSRFVQPMGHFSGELDVAGRTYVIDRLPGVVEDQDTLW